MSEQLYNGKPLEKLSDGEILELAGGFGPAIIGQELYERAQRIQRTNPGGLFGPAILDPDYAAKQEALKIGPAIRIPDFAEWDQFTRKRLSQLCAEHEVSHKANATKVQLIEALVAASVERPESDG
jgi:hypothetical protein